MEPSLQKTDAAAGPVISGIQSWYFVPASGADALFAGAAISASGEGAQTETLRITLGDPGDGLLMDPNAAQDGSTYNATTGVFTVAGSVAAVAAALEGLEFSPAANPHGTVTTFAVSVIDSSGFGETTSGLIQIEPTDSYVGGGFAISTYGNGLSLSDTNGNPDSVSPLYGAWYVVALNDAQALLSGPCIVWLGGNPVDDAASLSGGDWDAVYGSNANLTLLGAQASVFGGRANIQFSAANSNQNSGNAVSLYGPDGDAGADAVTGSNGTIIQNGVTVSLAGNSNTIFWNGADNVLNLTASAGDNWNVLNGSNGTLNLDRGSVSVFGGGDVISIASGAGAVSLYATNGAQDVVSATGSTVILNNVQATVDGDSDSIWFEGGSNSVSINSAAGSPDTIYGSGTVDVVRGKALLIGGADLVNLSGAGAAASLSYTNGIWDWVNSTDGSISLFSAQTSVAGGGNVITFAGGLQEAASLYQTANDWDTIYGSGGDVTLNGAQASVFGGGDYIYFAAGAGDAVSLYDTNGQQDLVYGTGGAIVLNDAQATISGNDDWCYFVGAENSLVANGSGESFVFSAEIGQAVVYGFNATDRMRFSAADFADWNALSSHVSQSGSDAVITLDAHDSVTLKNVLATSLSASQFSFS
jgi:hypothetical protein